MTLQNVAFRGDPDIDELRGFFRPEHQFSGDTRWTFGTSLKSAYVNCYDFMGEAPIVQLWRDETGGLGAVSRISLGNGEWFHQAAPKYRTSEVTELIAGQADAALELLTEHPGWQTVCHQGKTADGTLLRGMGYVEQGPLEVHMTRSLEVPIEPAPLPEGVELRLLDVFNTAELAERGQAQIDAFSNGEPTDLAAAWIRRSLPHQVAYDRPGDPNVIVMDRRGVILAFADVFLDHANGIGEFEPVGTRKRAQRTGLARAVTTRGLAEMVSAGMSQAVVRTGVENHAAIAAYESVGFETTDLLMGFRKPR